MNSELYTLHVTHQQGDNGNETGGNTMNTEMNTGDVFCLGRFGVYWFPMEHHQHITALAW